MTIDSEVKLTQSLKYYTEKEISGDELSQGIKLYIDSLENLDKKQARSFNYYIDFFEKEGENLYLASNKYLREEAEELSEFINKHLSTKD